MRRAVLLLLLAVSAPAAILGKQPAIRSIDCVRNGAKEICVIHFTGKVKAPDPIRVMLSNGTGFGWTVNLNQDVLVIDTSAAPAGVTVTQVLYRGKKTIPTFINAGPQ